MFKYLIYKFGQFCVNHLSLKTSYRWAGYISDLHYWFSFRDRKAVRDNLKVIYQSEDDLPRHTKEVFRNFGKYLVEFFSMKKMVNEDFVKNKVKIKNLEQLQRIVDQGRGGILLTAHIGNWELGAVVVSRLGYSLVAIALPHKERPVNDLFNSQREVHGIKIVPTHLAIRQCTEALKENKFVALLADRDFNYRGEVLEFLGRKTFIPRGAAVLSQRLGVPIVPIFFIREEGDTFMMSFGNPIYPPVTDMKEDSSGILLSIMKQYVSVIEEEIRRNPTQWLMFRKFWIDQETVGVLCEESKSTESSHVDKRSHKQQEGSIIQ